MLIDRRTKVVIAATAALGCGGLAFTQVAPASRGATAAKSVKVHMKLVGKLGPKGASGPVSGLPCVRGRFTSQIFPPKVKYSFKCKGGTFKLTATNNLNGSDVTGRWETVSGTGRFKHMRGGGPLRGSLQPGKAFILTGKVTGL